MEGFLVSAACASDDVPLGLFDSQWAAEQFAATVTVDDVYDAADRIGQTDDLRGLPVSTPLFVRVVRFSSDGQPAEWNDVKDLEARDLTPPDEGDDA
jgi:hypothetical protein